MVYTEDEKKNVVLELQKYLNEILKSDPDFLQLTVDGVYGPETKDAVVKFCEEHDLPTNGEVDKQIWDKIIEVYNEYSVDVIKPLSAFPSIEYIMTPNDNNMLVSMLQVMLQALGLRYRNCPMVNVTGIYDDLTVDGVKNIQNIVQTEPTGSVNLITWNHIATLFNELDLENLNLPQVQLQV